MCRGMAQPPTIPCPFLLPSSVTDLSLIRVSLSDYSIEGMLDPRGRLKRLHIESVHEGGLVSVVVYYPAVLCIMVTLVAVQYLPDTISLPPEQRDYVHDSLALTTF